MNYVRKRLLDEKNIDVNPMLLIHDNGNTTLHLAAKQNNSMSIQMLLRHPEIDINRKTSITRLHCHCWYFFMVKKAMIKSFIHIYYNYC